MIPQKILDKYDLSSHFYKADTIIFSELDQARFYYQIERGSVRMFNLNEDGKEFTQGYFSNEKSFGEPPLFGDFNYPANAITIEDSYLFKVPKDLFFEILNNHHQVHLHFSKILSERLRYKSMILQELSVHPPEHRILTLITYLKEQNNGAASYRVPLTRQQIADLTGLRVETVIRAIKHLSELGKLEIKDRKVYL